MVTASDSKKESKPKVILLSRSRVLIKSIQSMFGDIIDVIQAKSIQEISEDHKDARCIMIDFTNNAAIGRKDLETLKELTYLPKIAIIETDDDTISREAHANEFSVFIRSPIEADIAMSVIIKAIFR